MSLQEKIDLHLKEATLARDAVKMSTLRFLKSALKYAAIEKKIAQCEDADILQIIQKQIKQRRESITQFAANARPELAQKEAQEAAILESYLPKQLSDGELEALIRAQAQSAGAASKKDFGRMMKLLNEKLAGSADSKRISEFLGKILTA